MRRKLPMLVATGLMSFLLQPALRAEPPAEAITAKMAGVTDELNRKETGKPVQTEQKVILGELDKLISSLEKKCDECRGMKANNPTRGMDDSRIRRGTGGIGALVDPRENNKDWAKLSDRERDRILQSMSEGFPPEYRTVLERYYRRLAEEKAQPGDRGRTGRETGGEPESRGQVVLSLSIPSRSPRDPWFTHSGQPGPDERSVNPRYAVWSPAIRREKNG